MKLSNSLVISSLCAMVALGVGARCGAQDNVRADWARAKLAKSPRHVEYVDVPSSGGGTIHTFVVYPEVKGKAPVVVLIQEIFGQSDWLKLEADEVASKGYIAVVPDLLSAKGGTDGLYASGGQEAVVKAVFALDAGEVNADLDAVSDYGKKLPSASGKLAVAGFCWGGGKSFTFATHRGDLSAAFVFYGPPPSAGDMAKIKAPVYGFYAGNDARITATVPQATTDMKAAGKAYEPVTYDGAGHGFMRAGQAPDATDANKTAYEEGTKRMLKALQELK